MNSVFLIGRTTRDVELSKTTKGNAVATFTLAVDNWSKQTDDGRSGADFINCVAWNKTAEFMNEYVKKGNLIAVEGRIQTRNYENKEGRRIYVTEVICNRVKQLERRDSADYSRNLDNLEEFEPKKINFDSNDEKGIDMNDLNDEEIFKENDDLKIADDDLPF